jgi:hypothetical protein
MVLKRYFLKFFIFLILFQNALGQKQFEFFKRHVQANEMLENSNYNGALNSYDQILYRVPSYPEMFYNKHAFMCIWGTMKRHWFG